MAELNIGGEAFHVELEGEEDAPVLMLSHALATNLHMWDPQLPALLKHYRVLRYDARGHGSSIVSDTPYSIADLGKDVLAILDTLGLEKVDFMGLSLGGVVGQWLLSHAPNRIGKTVLANTAPHFGNAGMWNSRIHAVLQEGIGAVASGLIENWFTKTFRDEHTGEITAIEDMILATSPEGFASTCAALRDLDLREAIRSIHAPVLVITGRHDTVTPPGIGALITSTIPNAKLATLEAAHLSNIEDAEQFTEKALEFLLAKEPAAKAPKVPRKPRAKTAPAEPHVIEAEPPPAFEAASEPAAPVRKAPAKKAAPAKVPAKALAITPKPIATAAPAKKSLPVKKATAKKSPVKAPVKKAAPQKAAVKKTVKKAAPQKTVSKKAPAKKTAAKAPVKKIAAKTAAKTAAPKKAVAKKAVAKKAVPQKAAVKKLAAKKMVQKTLPSRKTGPVKAARKPVPKAPAKKTFNKR